MGLNTFISLQSVSGSTCSPAHLTSWDAVAGWCNNRQNLMERHRPVYKARLHTQTVNNDVSEDVVQLDVSNET